MRKVFCLLAAAVLGEIPLLYGEVCREDPASCTHLMEKKDDEDFVDTVPQDFLISHEMLEKVGDSYDFNQARLQLVRKKPGMDHLTNSHLIEEGKLYAKKIIIKENKPHWYYR